MSLNVREAAKRLGIHENTVRNWASEGVLTDVRTPGASFLRLDEDEVERLIATRNQPRRPRTSQEEAGLWWAGGVFVGEGTVFIQNRRRNGKHTRYLSLGLLMQDERTVTRFRDIVSPYARRTRHRFKANAINSFVPKPTEARPNTKRVYQFTVTGAPAESIARALHPYIANSDKEDQMIRCFNDLGLPLHVNNAVLEAL